MKFKNSQKLDHSNHYIVFLLISGTATIMISHLKREHNVIVEVIPYKKPKDPERFK